MSRDTQRLAYRLPGPKRRAWVTAVALGMAVVLLALSVGLGALAVLAFRLGSAVAMLPAIGAALGGGFALWLLVGAAAQVWTDSRVAPTEVQVSDATLQPGQPFELAVEQAGPMRSRAWRIALAATEHTAQWVPVPDLSPQGTVEQPLWTSRPLKVVEVTATRGLVIRQGEVWREHWTVRVPDDAVPSFWSRRRTVEWTIEITGDVNGWPKFTRRFPIAVTAAPAVKAVTAG